MDMDTDKGNFEFNMSTVNPLLAGGELAVWESAEYNTGLGCVHTNNRYLCEILASKIVADLPSNYFTNWFTVCEIGFAFFYPCAIQGNIHNHYFSDEEIAAVDCGILRLEDLISSWLITLDETLFDLIISYYL